MKRCILFAGPIGCSKTPVAIYLSWNLGLPVFNTDAIRTEVVEDKLEYIFEDEEYLQRRDQRSQKLIESGEDFIYDASVDRTWPETKKRLEEHGYRYFIISFNLSYEFWRKLSKAKNYENNEEVFNSIFRNHDKFVEENKQIIGLTITDNNFNDRLELALRAAEKFLVF